MKKLLVLYVILLSFLLPNVSAHQATNLNLVYPVTGADPYCGNERLKNSEWIKLFDWKSYLNDFKKYKNRRFIGPYYKIGIIGKWDYVDLGDEISIEFRLIDDYIGNYKAKNQLLSMSQTNYNSVSVTNQIGVTMSTTIGQTSVVSLGISGKDVLSASVDQGLNISNTLSVERVYSQTQMSSTTMNYDLNLSVIPNNQSLVGYGKIAVYVKYKIKASYRMESFWWGTYEEGGTRRSNYYAYKYIFALDSFIYPDHTFGDTETGIYPLEESIPLKEYDDGSVYL